MMPTPRRKKWSEAEERTLIDKYGEMVSDGTLAKMKTREKKFRPIALYVNSVHHIRDPVSYPCQWTWKDVSTKVQNMRHQYLLVKQKIKKPELMESDSSVKEEFEWSDGLSHWSNFLRYKEVFGDVPLIFSNSNSMMGASGNDEKGSGGGFDRSDRGMEIAEFGHFGLMGEGDFGVRIDGGENGAMGLGFEFDEGEENFNGSNQLKEEGFVDEEVEANGLELRKKKKAIKGMEKKTLGFLASQLGQMREIEARFERRELERERERQRREHILLEWEKENEKKLEEIEKERAEREKSREKLRKQSMLEWEAMEKESGEREKRRREDLVIQEREWVERVHQRRSEWKKRIDDMLASHRQEMGEIQSRILHEQQNTVNQLLGVVSQWTGHPSGLSDHTGASSHYLSQMMQNLHHVNGMVHDDTRVEGDNQDDQFIVDG
ncbi:hypothetical protein Nepgr_009881 [Nepenthes gracilis]|uniref:Uncharacterized protein n=1 Tax=Nepenthes gracilis TaxID=150966 RepID=A0AAD3XKV0_NEPGR|nr:hypothetical protein Nepgr_009881 [Nepenthes gracilis]